MKSAPTFLGPGLIGACVVVGPGSIMTSAKVGAQYGFQLLWVLILASFLMAIYMSLGSKLAIYGSHTPLQYAANLYGRWLAWAVGIAVFLITSLYQFGNNLGITAAIEGLSQTDTPANNGLKAAMVIACNTAAFLFLFKVKHLYKTLEKIMKCFVGIMTLAFIANFLFAKPDFGLALKGIIPSLPRSEASSQWIPVIGWVGTTFITVVALYQAYLVKAKAWGKEDWRRSRPDAYVGAAAIAFITFCMLGTAASVLPGVSIDSGSQLARLLNPLLGGLGQSVFCLGLFCAAFSSFLVNAMVGGTILNDAIGHNDRQSAEFETRGRRIAGGVLGIGLMMSLWIIFSGKSPIQGVVIAQAATVIAAPLSGGLLWALTSRRDIMGEDANKLGDHLLAGLGFITLLLIAGYLVIARIVPTIFPRG